MAKSAKYIYLSLGLSPKQIAQLEEMEEYFSITRTNVIRVAIDSKYEEMSKRRFGYKGVEAVATKITTKAKKEEKAEARNGIIEHMKELDDRGLTDYLHDLGYLSSGQPVSEGVIKEFVIARDLAGNRLLREQHIQNGNYASPAYIRDVFTWDEMIADMKKEGKL